MMEENTPKKNINIVKKDFSLIWNNIDTKKKMLQQFVDRGPTKTTRIKIPDLGHFVRSTWEINYCRILKYLNIDYQYESKIFLTLNYAYIPDIQIDSDTFIEIKGWVSIHDVLQLSEFKRFYPNKRLILIDEHKYKSLKRNFQNKINWEKTPKKKHNIKTCVKCNKQHTHSHGLYCQSCYNYIKLKERLDKAPKIPCGDGCGEMIPSINRLGKPAKYKKGHGLKGKIKYYMRGEKHHNYKGGSYIDAMGYRRILKPDHPNSDTKGYIHEHRLVMSEYLGRPLTTEEEIDHIDQNKLNNDIPNLRILTKQKHTARHMKGHKYGIEDLSGRKCELCGSDETGLKKLNGRPSWFRYDDGFICRKCYAKEYYNKKKGLCL